MVSRARDEIKSARSKSDGLSYFRYDFLNLKPNVEDMVSRARDEIESARSKSDHSSPRGLTVNKEPVYHQRLYGGEVDGAPSSGGSKSSWNSPNDQRNPRHQRFSMMLNHPNHPQRKLYHKVDHHHSTNLATQAQKKNSSRQRCRL